MTADLSAFFDSYYRLRPVNATFTGVHDHDDRLPDWSPAGLERALDEMRGLAASLDEAAAPAAAASLAEVVVRDRALARAFLDIQIAEHESAHFARGNPSLALGEAVFGVISLMTRPFAPASVRVDAATARLAAIPAFLEGARRGLARAVPLHWRRKAITECEGADRLLESGIARWLKIESIGTDAADRAIDAARRARAAVADFRRWLDGAPEQTGAMRLRRGAVRSAARAGPLVGQAPRRSRVRGARRARRSARAAPRTGRARRRLACRPGPTRGGAPAGGPLPRDVSAPLGRLPPARRGARPRDVAGLSDPLRPDPRADA